MLSLLEIAERAQKGPKMETKDWDLGLFRRMKELSRHHSLHYPGDGQFFNLDDSVPERALRAAVDFLVEQGIYCLTTGRVLQFTEAEVQQAIAEAPREVIVGEGRDARVLRQKQVEGREPLNQTPGHHAPFSEDVAPLVVKNFAQIPTADYIEGFNFTNVDGYEVFGMPLEAYAARREVAWMREGVRKAGRQSMAVAYYPISTRGAAMLAPLGGDEGLRRTDGILLSTLPDVKIELDLLAASIVYGDYGAFKVNGGANGGIGGFCGGVEGAIIEAIAKAIGGWLCYRDHIACTGMGYTAASTWPGIQLRPDAEWDTSMGAGGTRIRHHQTWRDI